MAGDFYYYLFSLVFVLGVLLYLVNLLLIRMKGKTTFGIATKRGTKEYENGVKFASNTNIGTTVILALVLIANLIYEVNRLLHHDNREDAQGILVLGTVFIVVMTIVMIPFARKQARNAHQMSTIRKKHE